jgi:hypothetical protein
VNTVEVVSVCDEPGCPIATEGRCLEGFPDGAGCPHLQPAAATVDGDERPATDADDSELDATGSGDEESPEGDEESPEEEEEEWVQLGSDVALSVSEADDVAGERGATVVLVAGEYEAGKTTLLVELYARFLHGSFDGWAFAGSRTLMAFDKRHFPTRQASGRSTPTTERTQDEDMRVLHLRLASGPREVVLMPSDIRGEFFEHLIDGAPVADEVPLAARSDKVLILINGAKIADGYQRQEAMMRAQMLVGALTEKGGVSRGCPTAIVLAKADLVDEAGLRWFEEEAARLQEWARERGVQASVLLVAARPDAAPDEPEHLEEILRFLVELAPVVTDRSVAALPDDRAFGRLGLA